MSASKRKFRTIIVLVSVVLVGGLAIIARLYPWPEAFYCFGTKPELSLLRLGAIFIVHIYRPSFLIMSMLPVMGYLLLRPMLYKRSVSYVKPILLACLLIFCESLILQYVDTSLAWEPQLIPRWYHCNTDGTPNRLLY